MRVVGIIQARMGSRRFPGKMLAQLHGRPLIWHIIARMRQCVVLDHLMLATSTDPGDDILAAFAEKLELPVFRGPEDNVLARFVGAAEVSQADIVVRINGDAPLVDPLLTDKLVATLIAEDADYIQTPLGVPCFHDGIDAMSRRILDRLAQEVGEDPVAREHVTGYLKIHPEFGKCALIEVDHLLQFPSPRLSVDVPADLAFFERLYEKFGAPPGHLDLRAVAAGFAMGAIKRDGSWG
jgi:spore coat polysaccharide biosynthesis protein SpsF